MFIRTKGKTEIRWMEKVASTAFANGALVSITGGRVTPATAVTTSITHMGVIRRAVVAADADFALTTRVPVEVPIERFVEWRARFGGGLVTGDIGLEVDATDSVTLNRAASAVDVALVREVLSPTEGVVVLKINGSY